jgi:hypothetical protein
MVRRRKAPALQSGHGLMLRDAAGTLAHGRHYPILPRDCPATVRVATCNVLHKDVGWQRGRRRRSTWPTSSSQSVDYPHGMVALF